MSAAEPTPAPTEEAAQANGREPEPIPTDVQQEIDRLCDGFAAEFRGCLEQFAQAGGARAAKAAAEDSAAAAAEAAAAARTSGLQLLAEGIGRIRAEQSVQAAAVALIDACALFCSRAALLIHEGETMSGLHAAGGGALPDGDTLRRLRFKTASAAALERAVVNSEAVETTGSAANVSAEAAAAFQYNESDRVHVYPLRLRGKVLAVVLVDGNGETPVETAAVEALTATAEAWIEAIGARRKTAAAA